VSNIRLKQAFQNAGTMTYIRSELGNADQPDSHLGGTEVDPREVKNAVHRAEQDGIVTRSERIALAQAWARVKNSAGQEAQDVFAAASSKLGLDDPTLLTAKSPEVLRMIDQDTLKGELQAFAAQGASGGGSVITYSFAVGSEQYVAVEIEGEFNRGLAIGLPSGTMLHHEYETLPD
jgi:hypothetical protein